MINSLNDSKIQPLPISMKLLIAATVFTFLSISLGVVVRITGSVGTCPQWPICSGDWSLLVSQEAIFPILHRLSTLLSGLLIVVGTFVTWRQISNRKINLLLITTICLFSAQVLLGAYQFLPISGNSFSFLNILLQGENSPLFTAVHLSLALVILCLLLYSTVYLAVFQKTGDPVLKMVFDNSFAKISIATLIVIFLLVVSGFIVSATGSYTSCIGWPLCDGLFMPVNLGGWINLIHRVITGLAVALMAILFVYAWRAKRHQTIILVSSTAAATLFFLQIFMGIFEFIREFPSYLLGLHTVTAITIFSLLVILTVLSGLAGHMVERTQINWDNRERRRALFKDFLMLTKPIVVSLLLVTTYAGMVIGAKMLPALDLFFWTMLAGALAAGGSSAINQYIDRFDDGRMQRTSRRPIPSGRLTPGEGLAFGVALCLIAFYIMVAFVNFLAAMLTLAGIVYYVVLYSLILKKTTVQNIVIGGGAGAIPPLVGWAAATGSLNIPSIFLFAVIFLWTPPHFWALALVRRKDYARAGVPMLPVVRGEAETRWQIFLYTLYLVGLTLLLPIFGLGGGLYFLLALALGVGLIYTAWKVWKESGNKVAWRMYRHSSMYLAFLFAALMLDVLI
jgi:heme o synthase